MPKSNLLNTNKTQKTSKIYLDYAASVSPNPSSIHKLGVKAKNELMFARKEVSNILKARSEEIIFTSGGTESNNLAIQGLVLSYQGEKLPHIITTNIEHPSVLETFKILKKRNLAEVSIVSVEKTGIVDPKKIKKEFKKNTILVSVMYVNNEIGTIQPIKEIAREVRYFKKNISYKLKSKNYPSYLFFHTDAIQAINYLDVNVEKLGVDMLSLSGSKIKDAGRVGVLYRKKTVPLVSIFGGGDQEMSLRPGTENLPEISKFAKALKVLEKDKKIEVERLTKLKNYFIKKLSKDFKFISNGDFENTSPNIVNITFSKIPSDLLVLELSSRGIMISSKSACKSSSKEGSYVIKALRKEIDEEIGGLRFSFGKTTNKKDIDDTIKALKQILKKLKRWYTR